MEKEGENSVYDECFDVNDKLLLAPDDMEQAIYTLLKNDGKKLPETQGDVIRSALLSLAVFYKKSIEQIEEVTKKTYDDLYIVGGGAKNKLLNEFTRAFTKKNVIALPIEATSVGNLKLQMQFDKENLL